MANNSGTIHFETVGGRTQTGTEIPMNVLVVDVGGSSVKLWHTAHEEHRKFASGKTLTPERMVEETKELAHDWQWEAIALGLPCRVSSGRPVEDPENLGQGWVAFNFASAFG